MSPTNSLYQQLRSHLAYLGLQAAAEALPAALDQAAGAGETHTEFLEQLLSVEVDATEARRLAGRMRFANFPAPWRLTDFDFTAQPSIDAALIRDLATTRYTTDASNVLFIGPPGVGKTMLAVALGHAAVEAGLRVYYSTAADLAARCRKAAIEGRWATTMRFFAGPPCSSSTSSATCLCPPKTPTPCSKSSPSATSKAPSSSQPTEAPTPGATSSAIPPSPPPCSTDSCTAATSSTSPATATASEPTKPAPNNTQPLQSHHPEVGNFADQLWGISLIGVTCSTCRSIPLCSRPSVVPESHTPTGIAQATPRVSAWPYDASASEPAGVGLRSAPPRTGEESSQPGAPPPNRQSTTHCYAAPRPVSTTGVIEITGLHYPDGRPNASRHCENL